MKWKDFHFLNNFAEIKDIKMNSRSLSTHDPAAMHLETSGGDGKRGSVSYKKMDGGTQNCFISLPKAS